MPCQNTVHRTPHLNVTSCMVPAGWVSGSESLAGPELKRIAISIRFRIIVGTLTHRSALLHYSLVPALGTHSEKVLGVGEEAVVGNVMEFLKGHRWFRSPSAIISAGADGSYTSASPAQPISSIPGPHLQLWMGQPNAVVINKAKPKSFIFLISITEYNNSDCHGYKLFQSLSL